MGKTISASNYKELDAVLECVDRARILLQGYDSQRVAETIEIVELLLSLYFGEDADLTIADPDWHEIAQGIFQRGELSEPLALVTVLDRATPRFLASERAASPQQHSQRTPAKEKQDWYGVDPEHSDSKAHYLAALSLRDSFSAKRFFLEAASYTSIELDVTVDAESDPDRFLEECQSEVNSITTEVHQLFSLAAGQLARAMEAVTLAETLIDHDNLRRYSEERQTAAVETAKLRARSEAASTAARARHARTRELKELAIKLFREGTFKSTRQASKQIFLQVQKRGSEIGRLLSDDRGEKTVYDWLLQSK